MSKKRFKYADFCQSCRALMGSDDKIVYVEEDSNRFFCSEKCIRSYYDPMAEHYRKQMLELRNPHDIPETDFSKYESYAPLCLSNADEVWMEENDNGETVYYFLANFTNEGGRFSYVVMCFCLEMEPTYILLSFPTRDKKLCEEFRRGQKLELVEEGEEIQQEPEMNPVLSEDVLSRQGRAIEEDMLRHRSPTDIPQKEFEEYSHLLESTIENPDEVWELQDEKANTLLTLIAQEGDSLYYIVICTYDPSAGSHESWRVIYSFPTNDPSMVQRYRRGAMREGPDKSASFLH